jgi:hypothetical protein
MVNALPAEVTDDQVCFIATESICSYALTMPLPRKVRLHSCFGLDCVVKTTLPSGTRHLSSTKAASGVNALLSAQIELKTVYASVKEAPAVDEFGLLHFIQEFPGVFLAIYEDTADKILPDTVIHGDLVELYDNTTSWIKDKAGDAISDIASSQTLAIIVTVVGVVVAIAIGIGIGLGIARAQTFHFGMGGFEERTTLVMDAQRLKEDREKKCEVRHVKIIVAEKEDEGKPAERPNFNEVIGANAGRGGGAIGSPRQHNNPKVLQRRGTL